MVSCIISAALPRNLLKKLKPGGKSFKKVQSRPGLYYHPGYLFPTYLIVCNLLPIEESNYPLLVFSSGNKLKSYLEQLLDSNVEIYFNYAIRLHPIEAAQVLAGRKDMITKEEKEAIRGLKKRYGIKLLLEGFPIEEWAEFFSELEPEESVERLNKFLIEVKKGLTPEQREELKRSLEN